MRCGNDFKITPELGQQLASHFRGGDGTKGNWQRTQNRRLDVVDRVMQPTIASEDDCPLWHIDQTQPFQRFGPHLKANHPRMLSRNGGGSRNGEQEAHQSDDEFANHADDSKNAVRKSATPNTGGTVKRCEIGKNLLITLVQGYVRIRVGPAGRSKQVASLHYG